MRTQHEVGTKVWFKGDEVTITTEAYELYGGEYQDAVTATGKLVAVATPAHRAANSSRAQAEHKAQQEQFSGLARRN